MDFYEALKSGTTEGELLKSFNEALKNAKDKIEKEKVAEAAKASREKELIALRGGLAAAIYAYVKAFYGAENLKDKISIKDVENILLDFEKQNEKFKDLKDGKFKLDWSFDLGDWNKPFIKTSKTDEEAIKKFLKALRDF